MNNNHSESRTRRGWPKGLTDLAGAVAFLFVALWVVVMFAPEDLRNRFQAAGNAVAAVAALAAAGAVLVGMRQLDVQRVALEEQRRAFGAQRFQTLRNEYAQWFAAATETAASSAFTARHDGTLRALSDAMQRLSLSERDPLRQSITAEATLCLMAAVHDKSTYAQQILNAATLARRFRALSEFMEPMPRGALGYGDEAEDLLRITELGEVTSPSERLVGASRSVLVSFVHHCIRGSLRLEELEGRVVEFVPSPPVPPPASGAPVA
jgi:hypothetical protein